MGKNILLYVLLTALSLQTTNLLFAQQGKSVAYQVEKLMNKGNWHEARKVITDFYKTLPPSGLSQVQSLEKSQLQRLELRVDAVIRTEEASYTKLTTQAVLKDCDEYLNTYPLGKYRMEVQWLKAKLLNSVKSFTDFITLYPLTTLANEARAKLALFEDNSIDAARKANTVAAFQAYLTSYPTGIYAKEAKQKVDELKEEEAYRLAESTGTVTAYERFLVTYPSGKYATSARTTIEKKYLGVADTYYTQKNWTSAITAYQSFIDKFPDSPSRIPVEQRIKEVKRKISFAPSDMTYLSFERDNLSQLGLAIGSLTANGGGFYYKFRLSNKMFSRGSLWHTIDEDGYTSTSTRSQLTGGTQYNNMGILMGFNFKIYNPISAYVGGGVLNEAIYYESDEYEFGSGEYKRTVWLRYTENQLTKFIGEAGIVANVLQRGIAKAGITYYEKDVWFHFGLGVKIGK